MSERDEIAKAEAAGIDCALNGASPANCHFKFFATPELKEAWERGYQGSAAGSGEEVVLVFERTVKAGRGRVEGEP